LNECGEASGRDALFAGLHREHALDVPPHGHQILFAFEVKSAIGADNNYAKM
jgi:hypothetical protein